MTGISRSSSAPMPISDTACNASEWAKRGPGKAVWNQPSPLPNGVHDSTVAPHSVIRCPAVENLYCPINSTPATQTITRIATTAI